GDRRQIDARSDVYGLGATLYEAVAGRPPFGGDTLQVLALAASRDPPSLASLRPDVDRDLAPILGRCLEKAPAARYPSAAALPDGLRRCRARARILARPPGPIERARKWGRRSRTLARALAGTVAAARLVGATSGALFVARLRRERDRADAERARA